MQKILIWYQLFLKRYAKKRSTWIQLAVLALLAGSMFAIHLPDGTNMTAGLCTSGSLAGGQILAQLKNSQSAFSFVEYESEEQLETAVKNGTVECGFWVEPDLEERMSDGKLDGSIHYICTPMTSKGEVMKETFYAAFFKVYSDELLKSKEEPFFGEKSKTCEQEWLEQNHKRQEDGSVFQVQYLTVESENQKHTDTNVYPVQGTIAILVLLTLFLGRGRRLEAGGMAVENALPKTERIRYECTDILASGTYSMIAGLLLVIVSPRSHGVWQEITAMLVFAVFAVIWVWLLGKTVHHVEGLISGAFCILVINVLICPVYFDLSNYIPAVKYIKYISSVGLYLGIRG